MLQCIANLLILLIYYFLIIVVEKKSSIYVYTTVKFNIFKSNKKQIFSSILGKQALHHTIETYHHVLERAKSSLSSQTDRTTTAATQSQRHRN